MNNGEEIHSWLVLVRAGCFFKLQCFSYNGAAEDGYPRDPALIPTTSVLFCFADIHLDIWSTTSKHLRYQLIYLRSCTSKSCTSHKNSNHRKWQMFSENHVVALSRSPMAGSWSISCNILQTPTAAPISLNMLNYSKHQSRRDRGASISRVAYKLNEPPFQPPVSRISTIHSLSCYSNVTKTSAPGLKSLVPCSPWETPQFNWPKI